jgi:hypothetical protein
VPKVYVVQEDPKKNLSPAMKFGEIVILCPFGQVNFDPSEIIETVGDKLEHFNAEEDYLLLVGDPTLIAICSALTGLYTSGIFKVLKWDRQEHIYYPIHLDLGF